MVRYNICFVILQISLFASFFEVAGNPVLDKAKIQWEIDREQDVLQHSLKRNDSLRQVKATKLYNDLKIDKEPDACAVFQLDNFRCHLDVQGFNRLAESQAQYTGLAGFNASSKEAVSSRRLAIVEPVLENAYLEYVEESSVDHRILASKARKEVEKVFLNIGETSSDSLLRSLYHSHANRFRGGTRIQLDILASTDSLFIDSLLSGLSVKTESQGSNPRKGLGKNRVYSVTLIQEGDKPVEPAGYDGLFALARNAGLDKWIGAPPGGFGHVLFKVRRKDSIPSVPFHEVKPLLSYLAQFPDNFAQDKKVAEVKLMEFYKANLAYFRNPDTLFLETWLWPLQSTVLSNGDMPAGRTMDTNSIVPLLLTQFDFPPPLRTWVYENFRCCVGNRWSPSGLPYGKWTFRLEKIVRGKGVKPFAAVRDSLLRIHLRGQDPYLQAENALHAKTRDRSRSFWRENVLDGLRSNSGGYAKIQDTLTSNASRQIGVPPVTETAAQPLDSETLLKRYHEEIRKWVSESLDLTALEE